MRPRILPAVAVTQPLAGIVVAGGAMAFTRDRADPKYASREHRTYRAALVRQLKRDGYLTCTADECLLPSRAITEADGRKPDGLHAGHEDNGVDYRGPQHNVCNVRDGAVRARARQNGRRSDWWIL